jgi:acetyltransferase-like isoleucine patch superfamily enzyme
MSLEKHESSYVIEPYNIVSYDCRKENGELPKVIIGKKCSIAMNCTFTLANHVVDKFSTSNSEISIFSHKNGNLSGYSKGDIVIKNDVWIGVNSTILDGITIGNGAVVAAGSVVTKSVPPYAIVGGNPAKIIKYRFSKDIIDEIESTHFWDMDMHDINKFDIHTKDVNELLDQIKEYRQLFNL